MRNSLYAVVGFEARDVFSPPLWIAWIGGIYWLSRVRTLDLYALAIIVLSVTCVTTAWVFDLTDPLGNNGSRMLLCGLVTIGLSASGGLWIKRISREAKN